jgi:hypothetical protein
MTGNSLGWPRRTSDQLLKNTSETFEVERLQRFEAGWTKRPSSWTTRVEYRWNVGNSPLGSSAGRKAQLAFPGRFLEDVKLHADRMTGLVAASYGQTAVQEVCT